VTDSIEFLDLADVLELVRALFGDPPPIRDIGLLGSAVARPQTSLLGEDAYLDIWTKAAALLQSVVNNHALIDGNKRLGWLATAVFLELNDASVAHALNDDVYELVIKVATNALGLEQVAAELSLMAGKPKRRRR
jgi:death-on-curing protein